VFFLSFFSYNIRFSLTAGPTDKNVRRFHARFIRTPRGPIETAEIVSNSSGEIYCRAVRSARVYVSTALPMHLCARTHVQSIWVHTDTRTEWHLGRQERSEETLRRCNICCQARGGDVGRVITGITWYQPICVVLRHPRRPDELHTLRAAAGTTPLSSPLPITPRTRGGQMI